MALDVQNQQPQPFLIHPPPPGGAAGFTPVTRNLFHPLKSSPLPFGSQKFLNLKAGETLPSYYPTTKKRAQEDTTKMSRRNGNAPKLDLKLNLSPPRRNPHVATTSRSATVSPTSPPSSCVSSELNQEETLRYSSSPEATSMLLVGCPRCLMYVMLAEEDPRCPKCKSTVLLDVLHENAAATTKKTRKS